MPVGTAREILTVTTQCNNHEANNNDHRVMAMRILLALAEVDPTVAGSALILPDGSATDLDLAKLRQRGAP